MAIDKVVDAIIDRIQTSLANQLNVPPGAVKVSLASPDAGAASDDLVVFLYLVTPDPDQRNAERMRPYPNPGSPPRRFEQAVPLDLRFLVTVGAGAPPGSPGLGRLAGAIRAVETASPLSVPAAFQSAVWLSLLPLTTDEMARIWGLFPNENCRTSFAFRAAPVWIDPRDPVQAGLPVTDDAFHSGQIEEARP